MSSRYTTHRRTGRRSRRYLAVLMTGALVLAAVAYMLLPTDHVNTSCTIDINDTAYSLPAGVSVSDLGQISALLARPGSSLDLTGDVMSIGQGVPATREMDGLPLSPESFLTDGAIVAVRHGGHRLEPIEHKTQSIPYDVVHEGSGPVVSLAQSGASGERELLVGSSSGKQAAVFVLSSPKSRVIRSSETAEPGVKLAALTFDDGPGEYTAAVLDALAAEHVPATFFVLGSSAAANEGTIERMKAAGHEVENHTWSHVILTDVSPEKVRSELSRTSAAIGGSHFLRPSYGISNASVAAEARAQGMRIVKWTVDTRDWEHPDVDSMMSYVKAQTKPGAIILMHDGGKNRSQTVAAIPVIVDWLFSQGYSLTRVDQLF